MAGRTGQVLCALLLCVVAGAWALGRDGPGAETSADGGGSSVLVSANIPGIDTAELDRYLALTSSSHRFAYKDSRHLSTMRLSYDVYSDNGRMLQKFTDLLARRIETAVNGADKATLENGLVVDVAVDHEMDLLLQSHYQAAVTSFAKEASQRGGSGQTAFGVFLFEPDLDKIYRYVPVDKRPHVTGYRYLYEGKGVPTSAWVGKGAYVVLDLSAGPIGFGPLEHKPGAVTEYSIPRRSDADDRNDDWYLIELARVVRSAVRNVFLSDFAFPVREAPEKVLISVLVFRDHQDDAAISSEFINMDVVREEAKKIFPLGTDVHVVSGVHSLHDHRHVAMALTKSFHSRAAHASQNGRYYATTTRYIDSESLFVELASSGDLLAKDLLDPSSPVYSAFFRQSLELEKLEVNRDDDDSGNVLPRMSTASHTSTERAWDDIVRGIHDRMEELPKQAPLSYTASDSLKNTAIVPIYVFSLHGWESSMMMDGSTFVHASPTAAVILQTNNSAVPVPFFADNQPLTVDARFATRNIVAGIAMSQGGIMPPTSKYAVTAKEVQHDYFWAAGHHPFDFFSQCERISEVYLGAIRRNAVLSRLAYARAVWDASNMYFHRFQTTYGLQKTSRFADVKKKAEERSGDDDDSSMVDTLFSMANLNAFAMGDDARAMLPAEILSSIESLDSARRDMLRSHTRITGLLTRRAFEDAYQQVREYMMEMDTYSHRVVQTVRDAETKLLCCTVEHRANISRKASSVKQYITLFFMVLCAGMPMAIISLCFYGKKLRLWR